MPQGELDFRSVYVSDPHLETVGRNSADKRLKDCIKPFHKVGLR
jgi:hypothetical protein